MEKVKNPFARKSTEADLRAAYAQILPDTRSTRKYLRSMAGYIEKAWEIGRRDGRKGKPLIPREELGEASAGSPLLREMHRRAYTAYQAGYKAGGKEVG